MKPVKYHPLAENELVGSAAFYEQRRPFLGDGFLDLALKKPLRKSGALPKWAGPVNTKHEAGR
jgi:hypothetical protein